MLSPPPLPTLNTPSFPFTIAIETRYRFPEAVQFNQFYPQGPQQPPTALSSLAGLTDKTLFVRRLGQNNLVRIGSDFIVFFQRLWSDWLARITGPVGLALAVVALFRPVDAWLFTVAGMLCVVLAAYRVWRVEYEHRQEVAFPEVQYPGGAYRFHIQRPAQRQCYIAATDITFTNRSVDRHVSIGVYLQVNHGLGTLLMYAPDNDPIANWREAAMLNDRPNSTQLIFPLNLAPKTSAGGHILFFIDDKERSIVGDDTFPKVKHIEVEELSSHEKRLYPVTATLECDARGTRLV